MEKFHNITNIPHPVPKMGGKTPYKSNNFMTWQR